MNWGKSIAVVYSVFALSMIGFVFAARNHPPQMVQKDYYDLDLNYQKHLNKKENTAALPNMPKVLFDAQKQVVQIELPDGMIASEGNIKCFQSATAASDFNISMQQQSAFNISKNQLAYGRWHFELDWVSNGKPYFYEATVFVP